MYRRAALRHFAPLSRPQYRIPHKPRRTLFSNQSSPQNHEHAASRAKHFQVKFVRPPLFSWQRQRKFILTVAGLYIFWTYILPQYITFHWEEVEEEVVGEDGSPDVTTEEGEEVEVEDGIFIPCGWPTKQERTYYRASDPEWKEFIKFANQKERHADVQSKSKSCMT